MYKAASIKKRNYMTDYVGDSAWKNNESIVNWENSMDIQVSNKTKPYRKLDNLNIHTPEYLRLLRLLTLIK